MSFTVEAIRRREVYPLRSFTFHGLPTVGIGLNVSRQETSGERIGFTLQNLYEHDIVATFAIDGRRIRFYVPNMGYRTQVRIPPLRSVSIGKERQGPHLYYMTPPSTLTLPVIIVKDSIEARLYAPQPSNTSTRITPLAVEKLYLRSWDELCQYVGRGASRFTNSLM